MLLSARTICIDMSVSNSAAIHNVVLGLMHRYQSYEYPKPFKGPTLDTTAQLYVYI